jgi:hypothetical protein
MELLTTLGVLVAGLPLVVDAYMKRSDEASGLDWLRDMFDIHRWSWWVPALWVAGMSVVIVAGVATGRPSTLVGLVPIAVMGALAVRLRRSQVELHQ